MRPNELRGKHGQQIIATFNPIRETHWIRKSWLDGERWHDVPMAVTIDGKRIPRELTEVKSLRMNEAKTILNPRTGEMTDHAPDIVLIQSTFMSNWWVVGRDTHGQRVFRLVQRGPSHDGGGVRRKLPNPYQR